MSLKLGGEWAPSWDHACLALLQSCHLLSWSTLVQVSEEFTTQRFYHMFHEWFTQFWPFHGWGDRSRNLATHDKHRCVSEWPWFTAHVVMFHIKRTLVCVAGVTAGYGRHIAALRRVAGHPLPDRHRCERNRSARVLPAPRAQNSPQQVNLMLF